MLCNITCECEPFIPTLVLTKASRYNLFLVYLFLQLL